MGKMRGHISLLLCLAVLGACATPAPVDRQREPRVDEIARALGCAADQVAVCIEVNCEPQDYVCAARGDVKELFGADDFRH